MNVHDGIFTMWQTHVLVCVHKENIPCVHWCFKKKKNKKKIKKKKKKIYIYIQQHMILSLL